jgi:phosphatidylethanolamine N-methyltransferase
MYRYERALRQQPHYEALAHPAIQAAGWSLVALGQILVVTSIYALGITGELSPLPPREMS